MNNVDDTDDEQDIDIEELLRRLKVHVSGENKNAVKWPVESFDDMFENSPELKDMVVRNHQRLSTTKKLFEDMYNSLYKYSPGLHLDEEMEEGYKFNRHMVNASMKSSHYEELRSKTMFDEFMSAVAARELTESVLSEMDNIEEMNKTIRDALNNQDDLQKAINNLEGIHHLTDVLKDNEPFPDGSGRTAGRVRAGAMQKAQNALNQAQSSSGKVGQQAQANAGEIGRAMSQAMQKAGQTADEFSELCGGWGIGEGTVQSLSYKDKFALAKRLMDTPFLKKVAILAGRLKRVAFQKRKEKVRYGRQEISSITKGRDLANLLPSEMLGLATPELEPLFMKKYIDGDLAVYERKSKEKTGKGPIVCCVDESGSMGEDRRIWAKAIALALAQVAMKEKRFFYGISFSYGNSMADFRVDPKASEVERVAVMENFVKHNFGGGTDFMRPLDIAMNKIENVERDAFLHENDVLKKADIVFITDGEAPIKDDWLTKFLKRKKKAEVTVQGILIGYNTVGGSLPRFSDQVYSLKDVMDDVRGGFRKSKQVFKNMS